MARLTDLLIIALYYDKEHTLNGSQLRTGTQNVTRAGPALFVNSVTRLGYPEGIAVYNLTIEDDHSYCFGNSDGGAWVHNDCTKEAAKVLAGGIIAGESVPGEVMNIKWLGTSSGAFRTIADGAFNFHVVIQAGDQIIDTYTLGMQTRSILTNGSQHLWTRLVGGQISVSIHNSEYRAEAGGQAHSPDI